MKGNDSCDMECDGAMKFEKESRKERTKIVYLRKNSRNK